MIASVIFSILNLVISIAIPIILLWIALTLRSINKKLKTQSFQPTARTSEPVSKKMSEQVTEQPAKPSSETVMQKSGS